METSLEAVNKLAEELKGMLPMKSEDQKRLDKKFRLEFNYNSNHIEGNTLTYGETELLLIFDDTKGNHTMREYEEMKAHDVALQMTEEFATDKERPLTEQFIKNLNKTILVRPYWKDAITSDGQNTRREIKVGEYKEYPNSVRLQNGEMFDYANPIDTPIQMQELIEWYRQEEAQTHPVILAAMLHYKFVRIHPFDDGNGRIARLLLNYVLLKNELPPVIIKSDDKVNYLRALNRADVGDIDAFIEYVAEQVEWSLSISIKAAKGESIEEAGDFAKEVKLLKQKAEGLDITKSPITIFNIFKSLNSIWISKINDTLKHFDGLFSDSKTIHYVNRYEEIFPMQKGLSATERAALILGYTQDISTKLENPKIFGYDIYETDIKNIKWHNIRYGLRGSKKDNKFEINLSISFDLNFYTILLNGNDKVIYKSDKKYNDTLLKEDGDELNKALQQYMLEEIKKRTQTEDQ